jgi:hypothetical protein
MGIGNQTSALDQERGANAQHSAAGVAHLDEEYRR